MSSESAVRLVPALLISALLGSPLAAEEPAVEPLVWEHQGFPGLSDAAVAAKGAGKRVLVGLSGGPT